MQFRATRCASGRFAMTYCDYGCTSYGGAANGADGHGSASKRASASSSRRSESYILIPAYALPPHIQGRNRVRQSRQHGSVRGYRAPDIPTATAPYPWRAAKTWPPVVPDHRSQVHGTRAKTALPNLADFPEQPRPAVGRDGLLRGANCHFSSALC